MEFFDQYFVALGGMPLPIAPEKIEITTPNQNKTVTLVDFSEVNILRPEGLQEIKFDMLLPSFDYPFVNPLSGFGSGSIKTGTMIANLKRMKADAKPIRFIISRTRKGKLSWWTNLKVSIEDFTVTEDANNGTDVLVSIVLKEYKSYNTKTAKVTTNPDGSVTAKFVTTREAYVTELITDTLSDDKFKSTLKGVKKITVYAGKTLYNTIKTNLGTTNVETFKLIKALNNDCKNVIETTKEIRLQ